jgi:hypothetical protein
MSAERSVNRVDAPALSIGRGNHGESFKRRVPETVFLVPGSWTAVIPRIVVESVESRSNTEYANDAGVVSALAGTRKGA